PCLALPSALTPLHIADGRLYPIPPCHREPCSLGRNHDCRSASERGRREPCRARRLHNIMTAEAAPAISLWVSTPYLCSCHILPAVSVLHVRGPGFADVFRLGYHHLHSLSAF
ncbi:unnamed protein product, partial [Mycena citricolor]